MRTSFYNSFTMGRIPLSSKAKALMQAIRFATQAAIREQSYAANSSELSRSRGRLAQYICDLEQRCGINKKETNEVIDLNSLSTNCLLLEVLSRLTKENDDD